MSGRFAAAIGRSAVLLPLAAATPVSADSGSSLGSGHSGVQRCRSVDLAESAGGIGAVTGVEGIVVDVRNYGTHPCTVRGYPSVLLKRSGGKVIRSRERHGSTMLYPSDKPHPITLQVEGSASFGLSYTDHPVGNETEKACHTSTRLAVKTSNNRHRVSVRTERLNVCGRAFTVSALQAGSKGPHN